MDKKEVISAAPVIDEMGLSVLSQIVRSPFAPFSKTIGMPLPFII
jgi:hypothetical protein